MCSVVSFLLFMEQLLNHNLILFFGTALITFAAATQWPPRLFHTAVRRLPGAGPYVCDLFYRCVYLVLYLTLSQRCGLASA